ncbi:YybS family protein [Alkalibacillus almallahensis]|uniref:YybS family protein n=1 Tax=Alkalibacillus almallahensis TaxID=1379154 RepID=UPI00141F24F8|nr:YybS family protein [Alkalibacillus almallahensis]NIK11552.1 uncharacterized protein YybS (DUF2232 family) [Alkalibacillus almallahensis]
MTDKQIIQHAATYGLTFLALLMVTFFVPMISILTILLLPIPMIIFASKYGFKPALILWLLVLAIGMLLTWFTIPFALIMGLGGLMIGVAIYQDQHPYEVLAKGTITFVVTLAVVYASTQMIFNMDWVGQFEAAMEESIDTTVSTVEDTGFDVSSEDLEVVREGYQELIYLLPTMMVLIGLFLAFVSQWLSHKWMNRKEKGKYKFPPFRNFSLPTSIIWVFLLGIIMSWIYTDPADTMYLAATNLYALPGLLLVLQGLSFIFYYTHYKNWNKSIPIIAVIVFVLFPYLLVFPLRMIGIIDLGLHLRKRLEGNK